MTRYPAAHSEAKAELVGAATLVTWPVGSFLENIAVMADGSLIISVHNRRELHRVTLDGNHQPWATVPASPAGLLAARDGLLAVAGDPGAGPHHLLKFDLNGALLRQVAVPDTLFLNGMTPGRPGHAYVVDSLLGVVIELNLAEMTSEVVLRDERLEKCSDEPVLPGANGIKLGRAGLYITNTDRALVLFAPFAADGKFGGLQIAAEQLRGDDFAIDEAGALYITNHIHNTLIRLGPDGDRATIAGPAEGMAGCTACVFHPDDPGALYVTTTGGVIMPLNGVMQEAKLVRLDVGVRGRPIALVD